MGDVTVLALSEDGARLTSERDAVDLVGAALSRRVKWIAIPAARLDPGFFSLRSGLAGAVLQKFVTYKRNVAIVGDISVHTTQSEPLAAFVRESNRGAQIWFVNSEDELAARLRSGA